MPTLISQSSALRKQEAHPSQRPWTLAGTKVGRPLAYRFDSEGKRKIGEPAHSPRLHLAKQNLENDSKIFLVL